MHALGRHLLLELFDCDAEAINSLDTVKASMVEAAKRVEKYNLSGWIGIQDTPEELGKWRGEIARELEELGRSIDDIELSSMIWFVITDQEMDQTPAGKASNGAKPTQSALYQRMFENIT